MSLGSAKSSSGPSESMSSGSASLESSGLTGDSVSDLSESSDLSNPSDLSDLSDESSGSEAPWTEYYATVDGTQPWNYALNNVGGSPIGVPAGKKCRVQGYRITSGGIDGWTHGIDYTHSHQPPDTMAVSFYGPDGYQYPGDAPPKPYKTANPGEALCDGEPIGKLLVRLGQDGGVHAVGTGEVEITNTTGDMLLIEGAMNDTQEFESGHLEGNQGKCGIHILIEP